MNSVPPRCLKPRSSTERTRSPRLTFARIGLSATSNASSVTEEAFDVLLNPIRAKVSLSLRVLSVDDLGFAHRGGTLFMAYLRNKESLAGRAKSVDLSQFGVVNL